MALTDRCVIVSCLPNPSPPTPISFSSFFSLGAAFIALFNLVVILAKSESAADPVLFLLLTVDVVLLVGVISDVLDRERA